MHLVHSIGFAFFSLSFECYDMIENGTLILSQIRLHVISRECSECKDAIIIFLHLCNLLLKFNLEEIRP